MAASRYRDVTASIRADWRFYRARTQWLGMVILLQTLVLVACMAVITFLGWKQVIGDQDKMRVYGSDTAGYLYGINPLKVPLLSTTKVQEYIAPKLEQLLTFSPASFEQTIRENKAMMTTEAQADYDNALEQIQALERWIPAGFALRAKSAGKLVIDDSAPQGNHYTWYVRQPLTLELVDTKAPNSTPSSYNISLLVQVSQFGGRPGIRGLSLEGN